VIVCRHKKTITFLIIALIVEAHRFCYAGFMDNTRRRAIVYGDSLILEGVQAELIGNSDLEVIMLDHPLEKPLDELRALNPAVIIFDLSAIQPDFPLAMLQSPDLLLIGINPETHQASVWSGRQAAAVVASDLLEIVQCC
jgi:hypothetical protein